MTFALRLPWRWTDPHATQPGTVSRWPDRLLTGLLVAGLMAVLLLGARAFTEVAHQQYWDGRVAASYTGWVGTSGMATIALSIRPCTHNPCDNVALDVTYRADPYAKAYEYALGGVQTGPHSMALTGVFHGGYCDATLTGATWAQNTTDGTATLTMRCGTRTTIYHLRSATLTQQAQPFN